MAAGLNAHRARSLVHGSGLFTEIKLNALADPGFPRGGTPIPEEGAPTYYLTKFSQKLHENEEILAQKRGASPWRPP